MNIFHEEYTLGQVASATGLSVETIKTWLRKELIWSKPTKADGPGTRRLHSFYGVMEIAVAAALIDAGVKDNEVTFYAARFFAHSGDGGTGFRPGRLPGCPFHEGLTYIAVGNGRSIEVCYRPSKDSLAAIRHDLGQPEVIILVEINAIFQRIVRALGHDPVEVMKIAKHDVELMDKMV